MTERWLFVYPQFHHRGVGAALIAEAHAIARGAGLEIVINGHQRKRGTGVAFTHPKAQHRGGLH